MIPKNNQSFFSKFRRQKEKRINPACLSPNGSNGSDGGNEYTKNLFTASLSSHLSHSVPTSGSGFVPTSGSGPPSFSAHSAAASVIAAHAAHAGARTQDPSNNSGQLQFHPLGHLVGAGFNSTLGNLINSRAAANETTSLG
jgi:hypothetical protein